MNESEYETKCYELLNNENDYVRVENVDIKSISLGAKQLLKDCNLLGIISDKELQHGTNFTAKMPKFYGNPKVHKQSNPLRPIISQIDGPTSRLNMLVDKMLESTENEVYSLIKDTPSFLKKIVNKEIPVDSILVTLDVASLYTRIPWKEGVDFVAKEFALHNTEENTNIIIQLMKYILENNYFSYNNEIFRQVQGTAMGARMAVKYANIYMGRKWEITLARTTDKPYFYVRLIDDIFMIWTHGVEKLRQFYQEINNVDRNIQYELNYDSNQITFLDTVVIVTDYTMHTINYIKPTNKQVYIHATSNHPPLCKKSLPYSQALRLRRNTTVDEDLEAQLDKLLIAFQNRGYHTEIIKKDINRINNLTQHELLHKSNYVGNTRIPFVIPYHPTFHNLAKTMKQLWEKYILSKSDIAHIFDDYPMIAFCNTTTIGSLIASSSYPPKWKNANIHTLQGDILKNPVITNETPEETNEHEANQYNRLIKYKPNTYPCCKPRCLTCPILKKTNNSQIRNNKSKLTCQTKNVIYLITCEQCDQKYVGQTGMSLAQRMTNHRSNIKLKKGTTLDVHMNTHSQTKFSVLILEVIENPDNRLIKETYWQNKLNTIHPNGINNTPCPQTEYV